jgi:CheY-like chemotaxis protein
MCANAQTPATKALYYARSSIPRGHCSETNNTERASPMRSTKGRILCTEDDVDTRELIDFVLTQDGYEVVCSASNVQAIDLAKTQNFDLYLVDNWMPGLSGTELTEKLRQFDLKTPVLFYSGAAYETDREAARVSGASGILG